MNWSNTDLRGSNREPVTVLVTAIGGAGYGEQILKALRLAGGYRIVGADSSRDCANFAQVDHAVTLPKASDPNYLDALLDVGSAFGVDAIFNGCEPELRVVSAQRERLERAGFLVPLNPKSVIDTCMDKRATAEFFDAAGFPHPRSVELTSLDDLDRVDWFPVVVKPATGGGGSVDCHIAQTPRELRHLAELLDLGRRSMLVQEYVGRPEDEYTVGVLHDLNGEFLNSIAVRRELGGALGAKLRVPNRTGRSDLGEELVISSGFSHGYIGPYPEVTGPCERLAAALGVRGAVNIQCRLVDGVAQVFEINPRLSGTTSLRAMVGYNEPDVLLRRHVLGETVTPRFAYRSARIHRSLIEHFVPEEPATNWTWAELKSMLVFLASTAPVQCGL